MLLFQLIFMLFWNPHLFIFGVQTSSSFSLCLFSFLTLCFYLTWFAFENSSRLSIDPEKNTSIKPISLSLSPSLPTKLCLSVCLYLLCILTSLRVLCAPKSWLKHFFELFSTFLVHLKPFSVISHLKRRKFFENGWKKGFWPAFGCMQHPKVI